MIKYKELQDEIQKHVKIKEKIPQNVIDSGDPTLPDQKLDNPSLEKYLKGEIGSLPLNTPYHKKLWMTRYNEVYDKLFENQDEDVLEDYQNPVKTFKITTQANQRNQQEEVFYSEEEEEDKQDRPQQQQQAKKNSRQQQLQLLYDDLYDLVYENVSSPGIEGDIYDGVAEYINKYKSDKRLLEDYYKKAIITDLKLKNQWLLKQERQEKAFDDEDFNRDEIPINVQTRITVQRLANEKKYKQKQEKQKQKDQKEQKTTIQIKQKNKDVEKKIQNDEKDQEKKKKDALKKLLQPLVVINQKIIFWGQISPDTTLNQYNTGQIEQLDQNTFIDSGHDILAFGQQNQIFTSNMYFYEYSAVQLFFNPLIYNDNIFQQRMIERFIIGQDVKIRQLKIKFNYFNAQYQIQTKFSLTRLKQQWEFLCNQGQQVNQLDYIYDQMNVIYSYPEFDDEQYIYLNEILYTLDLSKRQLYVSIIKMIKVVLAVSRLNINNGGRLIQLLLVQRIVIQGQPEDFITSNIILFTYYMLIDQKQQIIARIPQQITTITNPIQNRNLKDNSTRIDLFRNQNLRSVIVVLDRPFQQIYQVGTNIWQNFDMDRMTRYNFDENDELQVHLKQIVVETIPQLSKDINITLTFDVSFISINTQAAVFRSLLGFTGSGLNDQLRFQGQAGNAWYNRGNMGAQELEDLVETQIQLDFIYQSIQQLQETNIFSQIIGGIELDLINYGATEALPFSIRITNLLITWNYQGLMIKNKLKQLPGDNMIIGYTNRDTNQRQIDNKTLVQVDPHKLQLGKRFYYRQYNDFQDQDILNLKQKLKLKQNIDNFENCEEYCILKYNELFGTDYENIGEIISQCNIILPKINKYIQNINFVGGSNENIMIYNDHVELIEDQNYEFKFMHKSQNNTFYSGKQYKQGKNQKDIFIYWDIESEILDNGIQVPKIICSQCVIYDDQLNITENEIKVFQDNIFVNFIDYVESKLNQKQKIYCFAHNGGKYDDLFILNELIIRDTNGIQIQGTKTNIKNIKYKQFIQFCDTMQLLNDSLKKLCLAYNNQDSQKSDFDFNKYPMWFNLHKDEVIKYCIQDCIILQKVHRNFIVQYYNLLPQNVQKMNMNYYMKQKSLPALALQTWNISFNDINLINNDEMYNYERQSYRGGYTQVFQKEGKDINCYDINSSYPASMLNHDIPLQYNETEFFNDQISYIEIQDQFLYEITSIKFITVPFISIFYQNYKMRNIYVAELKNNQINYIWGIELKLQFKMDPLVEIFVRNIFQYSKKNIFKKYIEYYYNIKKTSEKGSIQEKISKLMMNSLYGKFGQRLFGGEHIVHDNEYLELRANNLIKSGTDIIPEHKWISFKELDAQQFRGRHIGKCVRISSFITACSRVNIMQNIHQNKQVCLYCDTDSIFLSNNIKMKESKDLGGWKLEYSVKLGYFFGAKNYLLLNELHEVNKLKIKSITQSGIKNALNDKEFIQLYIKERKFTFKQQQWIRKGFQIQIKDIQKLIKETESRFFISNNSSRVFQNIDEYIDIQQLNNIFL